jgi:hypothetical protein
MKSFLTSSSKTHTSPSFALISVLALVSLAALTATAFLASARLERQATMPLARTTTLDLALDAGACAASKLLDEASGEQFNLVTTYWRGTNEADWTNELGYLLVGAVPENSNTNQTQTKYFFCFSSSQLTNLGTKASETYTIQDSADCQATFTKQIGARMRLKGTNFAANQSTNIPLLGDTTNNRYTSPPVGWVYIKQDVRVKPGQTNTTNIPVARFAFYVQDLSSMIDADRMGGFTNGTPFRQSTNLPANYVQGTNPAEISLTNLTGTALTNVTTASNFTSPNNRMKYLSPGMLVLSDGGGLNTNDLRYVTTGLRHWTNAYERIPLGLFYSNCGTTSAGTNKYNLNSNGITVAAIAAHITSNLTTNFLARAGGLTNSIASSDFDYAKCLAANIVDYIDADSIPTALDDKQGYLGTEALPYCTEFALRFRIEDGKSALCNDETNNLSIVPTNNICPSINAYLELWNPHATNIPLSKLGISFRSYGTNLPTSEEACVIGCNQFVKTIDEVATNYGNGSSGSLSNLTFDFPTAIANSNVNPPTNTLASNAYCVIKLSHNYPKLYPRTVSSNNWLATTSGAVTTYKFIYSGTTNVPDTSRFVFLSKNTTNFSNACTATSPGVNGDPRANKVDGNAGILELSFSNVVYYRSRNLRMDNASLGIKATANNGNEYHTYVPGFDVSGSSEPVLNTGDPRITYFLRHPASTTLANNNKFTNSSFGGPNSNSKTVSTNNTSFSSPPPTNCKVDITQWPDGGHNPANYGVNPSGANAETEGTNEPISNSIVATEFNKAPAFIRNGPMTNILELGNIYDPILWRRLENGNITANSIADPRFGGGNSLRIGRPEHPRFAWATNLPGTTNAADLAAPNMQQSAAALLDLFCLTNNYSEAGRINLNTAPAPVLRALAGGIYLRSDPNLKAGTGINTNYPIPAEMAEAFAQGVMRFRAQYPFYSPSQLAFIATTTNWLKIQDSWPTNAVFGNTNTIFLVTNSVNTNTSTSLGITNWNDQAAEEWFSKIFSLSTVYSRNFRVYVIAQKATTNSSGDFIGVGPVVRKYYNMLMKQTGIIAPDKPTPDPGATPVITFQSYY